MSVHARDKGVLSPIVGWQVLLLDNDGQHAIGGAYPRRAQAMAFASREFGDIIGWRRLESTAWVAVRRADLPVHVPPRPRTRVPTGPHVPRWRRGEAS